MGVAVGKGSGIVMGVAVGKGSGIVMGVAVGKDSIRLKNLLSIVSSISD